MYVEKNMYQSQKEMLGSSLGGLMSYCVFCVCCHIVMSNILLLLIFLVFCVVCFALVVFVLCLVYQCCQFLWIVHS